MLRDAPGFSSARRFGAYGGEYRTAAGEVVNVYSSDGYSANPAANQAWAEFFGGLVHGTELSRVTVLIAPVAEVQSTCGSESAMACYSPERELLVIPGEAPGEGFPPEAIAAHEYGHHVAANRSNAPWPAVDWGPKRWASHTGVCARTAAGTAFPGDEDAHYDLNPGEAFAETYRFLNASGTTIPWNVSESFYPDQAALDAARADVVDPWRGGIATWKATARKRNTRWSWTFRADFDGDVRVTTSPASRRVAMTLSVDGARVATGTGSVAHVACGHRSYVLSATAAQPGAVAFTLTKP